MTHFQVATGTLALGTGKKFAAEPFMPWYLELGTDALTCYLIGWKRTRPYMIGAARKTGAGVHHLVRGGAARAAPHARWLAGTAALYASAVVAGYAIGATVGTALSGKLFGKQGARQAMKFYTGQGKYGEYFDIVGNFNTVYNALKQGDI